MNCIFLYFGIWWLEMNNILYIKYSHSLLLFQLEPVSMSMGLSEEYSKFNVKCMHDSLRIESK